jgi:hypothetical protein
MDGMVVVQSIRRGSEFQTIRQGDQLFPGQLFMQIVDPGSMLVSATVNQADSELLHVGAKAHLHFDAFPGLTLPGHVVSLGAMTNTGGMRDTYVKEIPVFLKVDQMDPRIIPDLSVSVDVILASTPEQVTAPLESVFRDSAEGQPYVFVKTGNGFERRVIELGLCNYVRAAIVSGLKKGEVVAIERPPQTRPAPAGRPSSGV